MKRKNQMGGRTLHVLNLDSKTWHFIFCQVASGLNWFLTAFENNFGDSPGGHKKCLATLLPRNHKSGMVSISPLIIFLSAFIIENISKNRLFSIFFRQTLIFLYCVLSFKHWYFYIVYCVHWYFSLLFVVHTLPKNVLRQAWQYQSRFFISLPTPAQW